MANRDAPRGLSVAGHLAGGLPNRARRYHIASGLGNSLFRGDACIPTVTSKNIDRPGSGSVRLLGVFDGCVFTDTTGAPQYSPFWKANTTLLSGTVCDAFVYDDPKLIFEIQADEDIEAADIGALADLTLGTGNQQTGQSADELDSSQIGSGANLKILDYVRRPDNELGDHCKVHVAIALHYLGGGLTAI